MGARPPAPSSKPAAPTPAARDKRTKITLRPARYVPLDPEHEEQAVAALARLLAVALLASRRPSS